MMDIEAVQSVGGTKLAGILGYAFLSRAIIEIPNDSSGRLGLNRAFIYNPQSSIDLEHVKLTGAQENGMVAPDDDASKIVYTPLRFISRIPHIEATVKGKCECPPSRNLMFLD